MKNEIDKILADFELFCIHLCYGWIRQVVLACISGCIGKRTHGSKEGYQTSFSHSEMFVFGGGIMGNEIDEILDVFYLFLHRFLFTA